MESIGLMESAEKQLELARGARSRRASTALVGDRDSRLRLHLMALAAGTALDEHESPGEATLHVLVGRVRLIAGSRSLTLDAGELAEIPPERHSVEADEDSALLLTVARDRPAAD